MSLLAPHAAKACRGAIHARRACASWLARVHQCSSALKGRSRISGLCLAVCRVELHHALSHLRGSVLEAIGRASASQGIRVSRTLLRLLLRGRTSGEYQRQDEKITHRALPCWVKRWSRANPSKGGRLGRNDKRQSHAAIFLPLCCQLLPTQMGRE